MWSRPPGAACSLRRVCSHWQSKPTVNLLFLELPFSVLLPPGFCLHSESEPVGSILEGNSAYKSPQSIRPVRVCEECSQNGTAEKLASRSNLWRDGNFSQPAIVL